MDDVECPEYAFCEEHEDSQGDQEALPHCNAGLKGQYSYVVISGQITKSDENEHQQEKTDVYHGSNIVRILFLRIVMKRKLPILFHDIGEAFNPVAGIQIVDSIRHGLHLSLVDVPAYDASIALFMG